MYYVLDCVFVKIVEKYIYFISQVYAWGYDV